MTTKQDLPQIADYIVWFNGLQFLARSNLHSTAASADAAGVPWFVAAWSAKGLIEGVAARKVSHGAPN